MSLPVTEDTPPDMLAGSMDLKVILPDGQSVKMSIQRSTPMMDLLVQVTTAHCLSPGDYSLQAMGDKGVLPFKPNTPIGALDTFAVKIVEKKLYSRGRAPQVPQSFLNSFRLQVHLPRSQLFVLRVTPDVTLFEIMTHICTEKNLNFEKYQFRNPNNLEEVLDLEKTLGDYKLQALSMVSKSNRIVGLMSSADMINVKSSKHRQNSVCESSLSSGSFGSRSGSPVPAVSVVTVPPQPPIRKKRRPAPKPPGFVDSKKKEQTTDSVLISHSRESSDSSGYHEASVLSESPTDGGPTGRMENSSPPDTLPRRSKLPPSQSFTNLTSIPSTPKTRLISSTSNTSLNSNVSGHSRKKRAPPPPIIHGNRDDKIKSSTLPISIAEERRNSSNLMTENTFRHSASNDTIEVSNSKVQNPVEITKELVNETKASKIEMPSSVDLDVRLPPKPKPRTTLPNTESTLENSPKLTSKTNLVSLDLEKNCESSLRLNSTSTLSRWNNVDNLNKEITNGNSDLVSIKVKSGEEKSSLLGTDESKCILEEGFVGHNGFMNVEIEKSTLPVENSGEQEEPPSTENLDHADQDSINWEYQLPPPPTDFRDSHSPSCTEFGTVTITPEVLEGVGEQKKEKEERFTKEPETETVSQSNAKFQTNDAKKDQRSENHCKYGLEDSERKLSGNKSDVMNELTNILSANRNFKEKSLSVSNLYINDSSFKDSRKNALNYSRSFTTEPVSSLGNFKITTYPSNGIQNNKKLSNSNEAMYDNEITYRNNKNLEKSSSMECIQAKNVDSHTINGKSEDIFRKPVAPIQKKLKVAKRSVSSIGVNTTNSQKRNSDIIHKTDSWSEEADINVLREQFLEFLKEKKLMNNDLNLKSLDVIRNILPELNGEKDFRNSNSHVNVVNLKNETNSQEEKSVLPLEKKDSEEKKVKIVEMKVKNPPERNDVVQDSTFLKVDVKSGIKSEVTKENSVKSSPDKKQEAAKRYTYQGPPSINFGTWGERPKTTTIIIKDEDYVTQDKVTKKKTEMVQNVVYKNTSVINNSTQKKVKKPQIVIKKPGVLSHYEMFSALPRRKEVSSLELVHMEDEEKKKRMDKTEAKEFNRVPVVCGVELKKEFKNNTQNSNKQSIESPTEPDVTRSKHSVSVYINGKQDVVENSKPLYNFILPKRNSSLMPVVKGFRPLNESALTNTVNISNSSATNHVNINIKEVNKDDNTNGIQKTPLTKKNSNTFIPPPPPLNCNSIKLKPVSCKPVGPKTSCQDPRGQLLEEIRNFGGLRKLKKSSMC